MAGATSPVAKDFVRETASPVLPPPVFARGAIAWMRANLFSGRPSTVLTVVAVALMAWALPPLARYLILDAVWSAPDGAACRAPGAGACWAYIAQKFSYFMYASYPREAVWRVDIVLAFGAVLIGWLLWPDARYKGLGSLAFFIIFPLLSLALLSGVNPFGLWRMTDWLLERLDAAPDYVRDLADYLRYRLPAFDANLLGSPAALFQGVIIPIASAMGVVIAVLAAGFLLVRRTLATFATIGVVTIATELSRPVEWGWNQLGLTHVPTDLWGGVFVSLLVSVIGIVVSLPGGILLALGRRSRLPMVKFFSVVFIEFVRGVPLITVLFMANLMLPLFVPANWTPDRLVRPLIGVSLFASAYMAEVIRGGLQAIPKGQFEGAMAVGLSYWQMMRLIILPQALTIVIPGIVNTFIGLFKDTTLVAIVGISDFLRTVDTARLDPAWAGPTISTTGYLFAAMFYFVFCFGMSRYSAMVERKLSDGRKR